MPGSVLPTVGLLAGLIYLHADPGYKPLRIDPRFRQLVERIGLR